MLVRSFRSVVMLAALTALPAAAQDAPATPPDDARDTRPALPTFFGDTGLWFVSTAETLPARGWSFSLYG